jgi:hypothetical protein
MSCYKKREEKVNIPEPHLHQCPDHFFSLPCSIALLSSCTCFCPKQLSPSHDRWHTLPLIFSAIVVIDYIYIYPNQRPFVDFLIIIVGYLKLGYPQSTIKKNKTLPANETSQNSGRDTSTAFRLVRGSLDGTSRLRSNSYETRSTGRLDYIPTRTRHQITFS